MVKVRTNTERKVVYNAMRTPDGTVLESTHTHDYRTHKDKLSGEVYMVDGGTSYLRRSLNKVKGEELSLFSDDPHKELRQVVKWGTYGKEGDQPLKYVKLCDMTDEHIKAVLDIKLPVWREEVYRTELALRDEGVYPHIED